MATYAQWAKAVKRPKVSWVCGSSSVLVESVVGDLRSRIGADSLNTVSLVAGEVSDAEVWAALNQYPSDPQASRFVLVRQAQRVREWDPFLSWLQQSRQMPTVFAVFVSGDEDFPYDEVDGKRALAIPVSRIKGRGAIVRCAGTEADIVAYVRGLLDISEVALRELLTRTGYSLVRIKDVVQKITVLGLDPSEQVIHQLCSEHGADDVITALFYLRKVEALAAARRMDKSETSAVISRCTTVLDYMEFLHPAVVAGSPLWEVVARGHVPDYPARLWWQAAKHFDPIRREKARNALIVADHGASVGGEGALEALIGLW